MTEDPDEEPFGPRPEDYFRRSLGMGRIRWCFGRSHDSLRSTRPGRRSTSNSVDEVPNSSWWTNRIGVRPMPLDEFTKAACGDWAPLNPEEKWIVTDAKPNGGESGLHTSKTSAARVPAEVRWIAPRGRGQRRQTSSAPSCITQSGITRHATAWCISTPQFLKSRREPRPRAPTGDEKLRRGRRSSVLPRCLRR